MIDEFISALAGYLSGREQLNGYKSYIKTAFLIGVLFFVPIGFYELLFSEKNMEPKDWMVLSILSFAIALFCLMIYSLAKK